MMRVLIPTALVVVLSGALAACGEDPAPSTTDGAATEGAAALTSTGDFCAALSMVAAAYAEVSPEDPAAQDVQAIKATVADLVELGAPADMPDDAREGFVLVTSEVLDLADDATVEELEQAGEDFGGADSERADAFDNYVDQTCDDMSGDDE